PRNAPPCHPPNHPRSASVSSSTTAMAPLGCVSRSTVVCPSSSRASTTGTLSSSSASYTHTSRNGGSLRSASISSPTVIVAAIPSSPSRSHPSLSLVRAAIAALETAVRQAVVYGSSASGGHAHRLP